MQEIAKGNRAPQVLNTFYAMEKDLGYGILLANYAPNMNHVTPAQYQAAQRGAIPQVVPVFWSFRTMIACGSLLLLVIATVLIQTLRWRIDQHRWVLRMAPWGLPLPWIVIETGWFVMEFDRQPWVTRDILSIWYVYPVLGAGQLAFSMELILTLYTLFLIAEAYLVQKYAHLGSNTMHNQRPAQQQE